MLTQTTDLTQYKDTLWLTEDIMHNAIVSLFKEPERFVHDKPVQGSGLRFRPDVYDKSTKRVWEFDGTPHYTNPNAIIRDGIKSVALMESGHVSNVLRIPYFVQTTNTTVGHYLDLNHDFFFKPEFPHGFVGKKCLTPAYFCSLGVERFFGDLCEARFIRAREGSNASVATEILQSLWLRVKCYGEHPAEVYADTSWYDPEDFPTDRNTQHIYYKIES